MRLLATPAELVRKRGWEVLGTILLAEAAGVSGQLVYEHFENVDALHLEVTRFLLEKVFRAVTARFPAPSCFRHFSEALFISWVKPRGDP